MPTSDGEIINSYLSRNNMTGPAGSLVTLPLHDASILSALSSFFTGPHACQTSGHQTELTLQGKTATFELY